MHRITHSILGVAALSCAAHAGEVPHAGDIEPVLVPYGDPRSNQWQIETNAIGAQGQVIPNVRVFASDFGDSGFPEFTGNPGFDALPGTFVPGTRVGFHAPQGLSIFDGGGLVSVTSQRLNVKFLTLQVEIGPSPSQGFDLAVQSNGGWHRHLSYTILDTEAELPSPNIYVLPMTLYSTDASVHESALFWMVFDYGMGQRAQDAAMEWITSHLLAVPCPADLDGDDAVGASDLAILLGAWGNPGAADLDADGTTGPGDLGILLGSWGTCS